MNAADAPGERMTAVASPSPLPAHHVRSRVAALLVTIALSCAVIAYCRLVRQMTIVSTHFAYVPIALAGLWWGRKALWVAGLFTLQILALSALAVTAEPVTADLARGAFFFLVAFCIGSVSQAAERARLAERRARLALEEAQQRLLISERLASMGQLSAGVAHEINNPLGTIVLFSHMLLKGLAEDDPHRKDLEMIVSEANRCKEIVRGLLDFARQSQVFRQPVAPADVLDDVVRIVRPRADAAGVALRCDADTAAGTALIDRGQFRQALVNLANNGIDACAPGGEVRLAASFADDGRTLRMTVADNGCGIPAEHRSRLFTPFFTTKDKEKGTGLGLAIVYGVVKMHGGDIAVESTPDQGTTFTIRVPAQEVHA